MSYKTVKMKFKCIGCGEGRPCYVETNAAESPWNEKILESLICVMDDTNSSFDWSEVKPSPKPVKFRKNFNEAMD